MKTPLEWDQWCNEFQAKHGRAPTWAEIIYAVRAEAQGLPEPEPEAA